MKFTKNFSIQCKKPGSYKWYGIVLVIKFYLFGLEDETNMLFCKIRMLENAYSGQVDEDVYIPLASSKSVTMW